MWEEVKQDIRNIGTSIACLFMATMQLGVDLLSSVFDYEPKDEWEQEEESSEGEFYLIQTRSYGEDIPVQIADVAGWGAKVKPVCVDEEPLWKRKFDFTAHPEQPLWRRKFDDVFTKA